MAFSGSKMPEILGFQGCIASFETNGDLEDPIKHALVPSPLVEEGCEGKPLILYYIYAYVGVRGGSECMGKTFQAATTNT